MRLKERSKNRKSKPAFSLLYTDRVVKPLVLQKKILKEFYFGHPGISRMKSLMRSYSYWPGMDEDIERVMKTCRGCARKLWAMAPPTRYKPWPQTDIPWSRIHIDNAGPLNGFYFQVVVDSYTKWPEFFKCRRPTATTTIHALRVVFSSWRARKNCKW